MIRTFAVLTVVSVAMVLVAMLADYQAQSPAQTRSDIAALVEAINQQAELDRQAGEDRHSELVSLVKSLHASRPAGPAASPPPAALPPASVSEIIIPGSEIVCEDGVCRTVTTSTSEPIVMESHSHSAGYSAAARGAVFPILRQRVQAFRARRAAACGRRLLFWRR